MKAEKNLLKRRSKSGFSDQIAKALEAWSQRIQKNDRSEKIRAINEEHP